MGSAGTQSAQAPASCRERHLSWLPESDKEMLKGWRPPGTQSGGWPWFRRRLGSTAEAERQAGQEKVEPAGQGEGSGLYSRAIGSHSRPFSNREAWADVPSNVPSHRLLLWGRREVGGVRLEEGRGWEAPTAITVTDSKLMLEAYRASLFPRPPAMETLELSRAASLASTSTSSKAWPEMQSRRTACVGLSG